MFRCPDCSAPSASFSVSAVNDLNLARPRSAIIGERGPAESCVTRPRPAHGTRGSSRHNTHVLSGQAQPDAGPEFHFLPTLIRDHTQGSQENGRLGIIKSALQRTVWF